MKNGIFKTLYWIAFILNYCLKSKQKYCVFLDVAIGDACYGMAYMGYLTKKHNVCIIAPSHLKEMLERSYREVIKKCEVSYYNGRSIKGRLIRTASRDAHLNKILRKRNMYFTHPYSYYNSTDNISKNYFQVISDDIFQIPNDIEKLYPDVKPCNSYIGMTESDLERAVILNPYSNSMEINDIKFWNDIVIRCKSDGMLVYTNIVGNQNVIEGTLPLRCSIFDFYNISRSALLVVSIRSGIIDFSIGSGGNFFVIWYNNPQSRPIVEKGFRCLCDLRAWGKSNIYQYYFDSPKNGYKEFVAFYESLFIKDSKELVYDK